MWRRLFTLLFILGLSAGGIVILLARIAPSVADEPKKEAKVDGPGLEDALKKARAGKYHMLLRQIKVAKDAEKYKDGHDFGYRDERGYEGFTDLPRGYWVYVAPYWYIWRGQSAEPAVKRAWGPEQTIGEPDTTEAGDYQTAWASQSPDGQDEWLLCEYAEPMQVKAVVIHETYNPGAVYQVSAFKLDGTEVVVWKGKDPTAPGSDKGVSVIPIKTDFKTNRVKIYLHSTEVPGWNEIDAVGLRDKDEKTLWASAVEASSTFAQQAAPLAMPDNALADRVRRLENEVRQLKESIEEMKKLMKKDK